MVNDIVIFHVHACCYIPVHVQCSANYYQQEVNCTCFYLEEETELNMPQKCIGASPKLRYGHLVRES